MPASQRPPNTSPTRERGTGAIDSQWCQSSTPYCAARSVADAASVRATDASCVGHEEFVPASQKASKPPVPTMRETVPLSSFYEGAEEIIL